METTPIDRTRPPVRLLGVAAIAALWVVTAYLVLYYALLLGLGPDRLHTLFGDWAYNALIAQGGFAGLLLLAFQVLVWGAPWIAASLLLTGILRLVRWPKGQARLALGLAAGLALTTLLPLVLFDGWPGTLWSAANGDDTEFAPGYSTRSFWSVRSGMAPGEVLALLGEPLQRHQGEGGQQEEWCWSRSPTQRSYRLRCVAFRAGRVSGKLSDLYVD